MAPLAGEAQMIIILFLTIINQFFFLKYVDIIKDIVLIFSILKILLTLIENKSKLINISKIVKKHYQKFTTK